MVELNLEKSIIKSMRCLATEERLDLEASLKKTKDVSEWKRVFSILSYDEGMNLEEIAKLIRLSSSTVEQYLKEYNSRNKTKNDPKGGGESKLTPEESAKLDEHLSKKTYLKVKDIVHFVRCAFGKKYSRTGMNEWLRHHGFTYKKPEKIPGKADPEKQEQFIEEYQKLKRSLKPNEDLFFADEIHPEYQSQAAFGWIKKGECKTLQTTGKQQRMHLVGAVRLKDMKIVMREFKKIEGEEIIEFLKALEEESQAEVIHVVLDNAGPHRHRKVSEFLQNSRIQLHYLPPYSPNLNPIERLWKIFRETTLYNVFFSSCWEFCAQVREFFAVKIHQIKKLLSKRITDNFQRIRLNPINST